MTVIIYREGARHVGTGRPISTLVALGALAGLTACYEPPRYHSGMDFVDVAHIKVECHKTGGGAKCDQFQRDYDAGMAAKRAEARASEEARLRQDREKWAEEGRKKTAEYEALQADIARMEREYKEKTERERVAAEKAGKVSEHRRQAAIEALDAVPEMKDAIRKKRVEVGYTEAMAKLAWGQPDKVNRTIGAWGSHDQWVYGSQYLYFENGTLKSIQTSR